MVCTVVSLVAGVVSGGVGVILVDIVDALGRGEVDAFGFFPGVRAGLLARHLNINCLHPLRRSPSMCSHARAVRCAFACEPCPPGETSLCALLQPAFRQL